MRLLEDTVVIDGGCGDVGRGCERLVERFATTSAGVTVQDLSWRQAARLPCLVDRFGVIGDLLGNRFDVVRGGGFAER